MNKVTYLIIILENKSEQDAVLQAPIRQSFMIDSMFEMKIICDFGLYLMPI